MDSDATFRNSSEDSHPSSLCSLYLSDVPSGAVRHSRRRRMSSVHIRFAAVGLLSLAMAAAACSQSSASFTSSGSTSSSGFVVTPQLWGEMKPTVPVKELMRDMIDPIADNIFDAIAVTTDKNGTVEHTPKTDEEWAKVRIGGVTMAEGAYL